MSIGEKVRETRKGSGLSQEEVARRAGVTMNVISRLERGEIRDPHFSTLRGLTRALSIPIEELVGEDISMVVGKTEAPESGLGRAAEEETLVYNYYTTAGERDEAFDKALDRAREFYSEYRGFLTTIGALAIRDDGEAITVSIQHKPYGSLFLTGEYKTTPAHVKFERGMPSEFISPEDIAHEVIGRSAEEEEGPVTVEEFKAFLDDMEKSMNKVEELLELITPEQREQLVRAAEAVKRRVDRAS